MPVYFITEISKRQSESGKISGKSDFTIAFKRIHAIISDRCQHFFKEIRTDLWWPYKSLNKGVKKWVRNKRKDHPWRKKKDSGESSGCGENAEEKDVSRRWSCVLQFLACWLWSWSDPSRWYLPRCAVQRRKKRKKKRNRRNWSRRKRQKTNSGRNPSIRQRLWHRDMIMTVRSNC